MRMFKNLELILSTLDLTAYRATLLKLAVSRGYKDIRINGFNYKINDDANRVTVDDRPVVGKHRLAHDTWLVNNVDHRHDILGKMLTETYFHYIMIARLNIYEYVDMLVEFHLWLKDNLVNRPLHFDTSNCKIPYIRRAMDVLRNVDYVSLRNYCYGVGEVVLYQGDNSYKTYCYVDNNLVNITCKSSGVVLTPLPAMFDKGANAKELIALVDSVKPERLMNGSINSTLAILSVLTSVRRLRGEPRKIK